MNKERRAALAKINERIEALKTDAESIREELESLKDEEQEYYDNMPEGFQNGDRGQRASEVVDQLDTAVQGLDGIDWDDITNNIESACE